MMGPGIYEAIRRSNRQAKIIEEIQAEWRRQEQIWGFDRDHPDGTGGSLLVHERDMAQAACRRASELGHVSWMQILREEYTEAVAELAPDRIRAELIQVAAICASWIDALDMRRQLPQEGAAGGVG